MRTRLAPSPTGFLHVGTLRTALFNYLLARQTKGTFLVRIEDTDQEREVEGAVENICQTLKHFGLEPDEGVFFEEGEGIKEKGAFGPYIQSKRAALYRDSVEKLLESGHAYRAFDTVEDLEAMRATEMTKGNPSPKYDALVRMRMKNALTMESDTVADALKRGVPSVVRLRIPEGRTFSANDAIRGHVSFASKDIDDTVLLKSDGFPTYHLANVIDDHLMEIDMVLRGEEWLPSLPKHLLLYEAFGWKPPQFAHVPLLLSKGGGKLSKRQNAVSAMGYAHYLPEAVLNFLALLGWNPGTKQEIFSKEELIAAFSLNRIQKAGAVFDVGKLDWLQKQWMKRLEPRTFTTNVLNEVSRTYPQATTDPAFPAKAALLRERIAFFREASEMMGFFYEEPTVTLDLLANVKQGVSNILLPKILEALQSLLSPVPEEEWNEEQLRLLLTDAAEEKQWKIGQILWPLRAALTGRAFSPGAFEVATLLGKEGTLRRLKKAQKTV